MKRLQYILLFELISLSIIAQIPSTTPADTIDNDTTQFLVTDNVEVIKSFEAKLGEATIVNVNPQTPEITPIERDYDYEVTIIPYEIIYPEPIIRPIAMRKDDPVKFKNWMVKGGYGNLSNAYGKVTGHHRFNDRVDWRLQAEFHNANNSNEINLQQYSSFFLESAQDFNILETSKLATYAQIGRDSRYFFYNGPDRQDVLSEEEGLRNRDQVGIGVSFYNAFDTDTKVDYNIDFKNYITRLSDVDQSEINTIFQASVTKTNNNMSLTFNGGVDYNHIEQGDFLGFAFPKLSISGSSITFDLGLSYIYADAKSNVFPQAEIRYAIDEKLLQAYAGVKQNYQRNNINNTTSYNSFASGMDSLSTNINIDYYGGVKGDILGIIYQAKAGYKEVDNLAIFNVDYNDRLRRLHTSTTSLNTVYISGSIEYPLGEWVNIGGNLTQNFFSDVESEELWGIPSLELNAFASLHFFDKIITVSPNLFIRDRVNAIDHNNMSITLDDLIDFNLEVQINPSEYFGIWFKGLNLFDKTYRRWYGYNNFGIHFQGGIVGRF